MKFRKIFKIISGIIVFFTLPTLLLFAFLYLRYNEPLPSGEQGKAADELATTMLKSLDYQAFKNTSYLAWSFKNMHYYKWNKADNICEVRWKHVKVILNLNNTAASDVYIDNNIYNGQDRQKLINRATDYFNNDSFWLVAPYKVFDSGVERRIVQIKDNKDALLVTYTSGGSTPGDSYLWHLDSDGKPTHFQMWVSILPIGGLEASWNDWTTCETGLQLPTFHKMLILGIELDGIECR